jgi:hypothetical protein
MGKDTYPNKCCIYVINIKPINARLNIYLKSAYDIDDSRHTRATEIQWAISMTCYDMWL